MKDKQIGGDYYKKLAVQPWDFMESLSHEHFEGFLRFNVIKYVARYPAKDGTQDLRKAAHYLEALLEFLELEHD